VTYTRRRSATLLVAAVVVALAPGRATGETPAADKPGRTFGVVELEGAPYQRGLKHGRELRDTIRSAVAVWKEDLRRTYETDPDVFVREFLARTNYVPAIEKWTPELLEEVRGISEGSGTDFPTMLTYQLVDEYWVNGSDVLREHCSGLGIAATASHPAIVAQNMDLEGFRDGLQTLLHIKDPSGLEAYVLTMPGLIGVNGMNNKGVGVTANTLAQLAHNRDGLPVAFVVRGALQSSTFGEIETFLKGVRHASGQNYTVGASGRVAYFEASARGVVEVSSSGGFIYHTNHPLANDDYSEEGSKEMHQPPFSDSTRTRYEALKRHLAADPGESVVDLIKETLRSRDSDVNPVCRGLKDRSSTFTYGSTIMVLSGHQPYLLAAPGPPDQYEYTTFRFAVAGP
jgi:isopenicillin-N N-acyltransferase-like protein